MGITGKPGATEIRPTESVLLGTANGRYARRLNLGNQYAQCFSFACDSETYINNVPVVTCHCAIGATLAGTPAKSRSSFVTEAGQGDPAFCAEHPVGNAISLPSP